MRQDGEPSVEEILESIKKVIARDNRDTAFAERRRRQPTGDARPIPDVTASTDPEVVLDLGVEDELTTEYDDDVALTTEHAAGAMRESLAALAMLAEPGVRPQIVRSGETSLEDLVREMLRPMLAQWLEAHLPDIVDRAVQAEISRIAGKKG